MLRISGRVNEKKKETTSMAKVRKRGGDLIRLLDGLVVCSSPLVRFPADHQIRLSLPFLFVVDVVIFVVGMDPSISVLDMTRLYLLPSIDPGTGLFFSNSPALNPSQVSHFLPLTHPLMI